MGGASSKEITDMFQKGMNENNFNLIEKAISDVEDKSFDEKQKIIPIMFAYFADWLFVNPRNSKESKVFTAAEVDHVLLSRKILDRFQKHMHSFYLQSFGVVPFLQTMIGHRLLKTSENVKTFDALLTKSSFNNLITSRGYSQAEDSSPPIKRFPNRLGWVTQQMFRMYLRPSSSQNGTANDDDETDEQRKERQQHEREALVLLHKNCDLINKSSETALIEITDPMLAARELPLISFICFSDHPDTLTLLKLALELGYDVNEQASTMRNKTTPLHLASQNTSKKLGRDIIVELLMYNPNKNLVDTHGNSALHFAATNTINPEICAELISCGGFPHLENNNGETPLIKAVKCGAGEEVISMLLAGGATREDFNKTIREADRRKNIDDKEITLMEHAVAHQHYDTVVALQKQGFAVENKESLLNFVARNDSKMKNIISNFP